MASDSKKGQSNVVLVGMMGTGKSSIGKLVAQSLNYEFTDTDSLIEEAAGCTISQMFEEEGEAFFRRKETATLRGLLDLKGHVISTGGGIILKRTNRDLIKELGYVIWLTASPETLLFRIGQNRDRPLMQTEDPKATLQALLEKRDPLYNGLAELTVDTSELTLEETAHGVVESIKYHFASHRAS